MEKWIPTNLRLDGVSHQGARPWVNHYYFHLISWWVTCPSMNGDPIRDPRCCYSLQPLCRCKLCRRGTAGGGEAWWKTQKQIHKTGLCHVTKAESLLLDLLKSNELGADWTQLPFYTSNWFWLRLGFICEHAFPSPRTHTHILVLHKMIFTGSVVM